MKKFLALMLTLCMALSLLPVSAMAARLHDDAPVAETALGDEAVTAAKPAAAARPMAEEDEAGNDAIDWTATEITLSTVDELKAFAEQVNAGTSFDGRTVTLGADLDLENEAWTPIGTVGKEFKGTFDGGGHTVSNLTVTGGDYVGLFGRAMNGKKTTTVKNVTIHNATVSGGTCVAALAGSAYTGAVENCHVTGNIQITGNYDVGGLTGYGYAKLTDCSVVGGDGSAVTGIWAEGKNTEGDNVGGLMGFYAEGTGAMTDCRAENLTVTGTRKVGGLVGSTYANRNFINCSVKNVTVGTNATAAYAGDNQKTMGIGGLIGLFNNTNLTSNSGGKLENCSVKNVTLSNPDEVFAKMGYVSGGTRVSEEFGAPVMTEIDVTISGDNTGTNVTINDPALSGNIVETEDTVAKLGGQYFTSLQAAIDAAEDGDTVTLVADVTTNQIVAVNKSLTIEGNGHAVNSTANRILWIDANDVAVTLNDIEFKSEKAERGVQVNVGRTGVELNINRCTVPGTYYAINMCSNTSVALNINDSTVNGWGALNLWGKNYEVKVTNSTLTGHNDKSYSAAGWNGFGVIVLEGDTTGKTDEHVDGCHVVLENCHIVASTAVNADGNANIQKVILFNPASTNNVVEITGEDTVVEYAQGDLTPFCAQNGFENTLTISGGAFSGDVTEYVVEGACRWNEGERMRVGAHNADGEVEHKDATCTESGVVGGAYCANCGEGKEAAEVGIDPLGHTEVVDAAVAATCTAPGMTEGSHCSVCDVALAERETVPATGHSLRWAYDENGHWQKCDNCDFSTKDQTLAHTWVPGTVSGGRRTDTCECGAERTETVSSSRPTAPVASQPEQKPEEQLPEEDLNDPEVPLAQPFLFADVSANDWFYDAVKYISAKDIMKGTNGEGTRFSPQLNTTRGSVAAILHRLEDAPDATMADFADVLDGKWYTEAVNWTDASGLMIGFEDGTFRPEDDVTREQLVTVLYRYAKRLNRDVTAAADLSAFEDVDNVSGWAADAMGWAVSTGLIRGRDGSALAPQGVTTRGELAIILQRFLEMK